MAAFKETVLITGATRGIGAQLLSQLRERRDTRVIAAVRDLNSASSQKLIEQAAATRSPQGQQQLIVVKIDSESDTDALEAARVLQSEHGVAAIDLVIANAGVTGELESAADVSVDDFRRTFNINTAAPLLLFQALRPLLLPEGDKKEEEDSSRHPRLLLVSTLAGSLGLARHVPYRSTTYGASKAALNFVALRIAIEHPDLTVVPLHPGLVHTDMATAAEASVGRDINETVSSGTAITAEESAQKILKLADEARPETHSGKFFNVQSWEEIPW